MKNASLQNQRNSKAQYLAFITVAIFALVSLIHLQPAYSKETPDELAYWTKTDLKFDFLKDAEIIVQEQCSQNIMAGRFCLKSLNALANTAEPARSLLPKTIMHELTAELSKNGSKIEIEKDFGAVVLVKTETDLMNASKDNDIKKRSMREVAEQLENKRVMLNNAYDVAAHNSLNYDAIRDYLGKTLIRKDREAWQTKIAIESLFLQMDGHVSLHTETELADLEKNAGEVSFGGIGLGFHTLDGKVVVHSITDGGPAEKFDFKNGDIIVGVNNINVSNKNAEEITKLIRGPVGSLVTITIERDGAHISHNITRAKIEYKNVTIKPIESGDHKVGYIKLNTFMNLSGCKLIKNGILEFQRDSQIKGLILDLRGNGGGRIDQATCMAGLFVGKKTITIQQSLIGEKDKKFVSEEDKITDLPLVVLIDAGSASASELLSGALRDYERAWILGDISFGKGTVQQAMLFKEALEPNADNIAIFKTIARFLQPMGSTNQIVGIKPHFSVPFKPDATQDELFRLREKDLVPNAIEAQLDHAWVEPTARVNKIEEINACTSSKGKAKEAYTQVNSQKGFVDYQLLSAIDVLNCDK